MTHRKGEEELTRKVEKAHHGKRFLVVVGRKSVRTIPLPIRRLEKRK